MSRTALGRRTLWCGGVFLVPVLMVTGCITAPPQSNDLPSDVPSMTGTWTLGNGPVRLATFVFDANGDITSGSMDPNMFGAGLPFEIPTELIFDGYEHTITIPVMPVGIIYQIAAVTTKEKGDKATLVVGDIVKITVSMKLWADIPVPFIGKQEIGEGRVEYQGTVTSVTAGSTAAQAQGPATVTVVPSATVTSLVQMAGITIPIQNMNQTIQGVTLTRQ